MEQTDRFWTGHTKTVVFISTQNDLCFGVYVKSNRLVVDTVDVWVTDCAQVIRNEFEEIGSGSIWAFAYVIVHINENVAFTELECQRSET